MLEKNEQPGGRARQLKEAGFTFDMGPSWYWMPDVFERFFAQFGKNVSDYYSLKRLDPSYRIYGKEESLDIPAGFDDLKQVFENFEPGAGRQLERFMKEAAIKYRIGMEKLVYKPGLSPLELVDRDILSNLTRLDVFSSMKSHVAKYFNHSLLRQMLEFPVLFLGAMPSKIPALYSLMNHADIMGGTWYPEGGMYKVVEAMYALARELGVNFSFHTSATGMYAHDGKIRGVETNAGFFNADAVIAAADYHHVEQRLLPEVYRTYSAEYWEKRTMAPGAILYFLGVDKKIDGLSHHSLFFDADFNKHGRQIYEQPSWPDDPLFYMCAPSVTDDGVAPTGCENLFLLIPVAAGLKDDSTKRRDAYFDTIITRVEDRLQTSFRQSIIYRKSFSISDFVSEYNSFKGNAYGLANTLMQTAVLKPRCRSNKLRNLYYAGQLTVPGPGVPPSLISGEVVARELIKNYSN